MDIKDFYLFTHYDIDDYKFIELNNDRTEELFKVFVYDNDDSSKETIKIHFVMNDDFEIDIKYVKTLSSFDEEFPKRPCYVCGCEVKEMIRDFYYDDEDDPSNENYQHDCGFDIEDLKKFCRNIYYNETIDFYFSQKRIDDIWSICFKDEETNTYGIEEDGDFFHIENNVVYHSHPWFEEECGIYCSFCSCQEEVIHFEELGYLKKCPVLTEHIDLVYERLKNKAQDEALISHEERMKWHLSRIENIEEKRIEEKENVAHSEIKITFPTQNEREEEIIHYFEKIINDDRKNNREVHVGYHRISKKHSETKISLSIEGVVLDAAYHFKPMFFDDVYVVNKNKNNLSIIDFEKLKEARGWGMYITDEEFFNIINTM